MVPLRRFITFKPFQLLRLQRSEVSYRYSEDTWEPAKHLDHAPDKVKEFHSKNPGAPRKIAALIYASLPWQQVHKDTMANTDVDP